MCPVVVGRDAELSALCAALVAALRGGEGSLVCLTGEPGIGRSRLARELAAEARNRGAAVVTGRAVPAGSNTACQRSVRPDGAPKPLLPWCEPKRRSGRVNQQALPARQWLTCPDAGEQPPERPRLPRELRPLRVCPPAERRAVCWAGRMPGRLYARSAACPADRISGRQLPPVSSLAWR